MPDLPATLNGSCHCGQVRLTFPMPEEAVNECQCSICRRYGAVWAYYPPEQVTITLADPAAAQQQQTYAWGERKIAFVRCAGCGCVTHWAPIPGGGAVDDGLGVNCRVLEKVDLDRLPRYFEM